MLRSLLFLLFVAYGQGLSAQETNTRPKLTVKAHYGVRGHHTQDGLFHGPGIQAGVNLNESWMLMAQHDRLVFNSSNGRFQSTSVGIRHLQSKPENTVQFHFDWNLALLSHRPFTSSKYNTGWEFEIGFGLGTYLSKSLKLELQILTGFGRIYGERRTDGDVVLNGKNYVGFIEQAIQFGAVYQLYK